MNGSDSGSWKEFKFFQFFWLTKREEKSWMENKQWYHCKGMAEFYKLIRLSCGYICNTE